MDRKILRVKVKIIHFSYNSPINSFQDIAIEGMDDIQWENLIQMFITKTLLLKYSLRPNSVESYFFLERPSKVKLFSFLTQNKTSNDSYFISSSTLLSLSLLLFSLSYFILLSFNIFNTVF